MTSPSWSVVWWPLEVTMEPEMATRTDDMGDGAIVQGLGLMQMVLATDSSGEVNSVAERL